MYRYHKSNGVCIGTNCFTCLLVWGVEFFHCNILPLYISFLLTKFILLLIHAVRNHTMLWISDAVCMVLWNENTFTIKKEKLPYPYEISSFQIYSN